MSFSLTGALLIYQDLSNRVTNLRTSTLLNRTPPDSYDGRALNILIIGSDTRAGEGNQTLTNNDDPTERSDTTMIMHISKDRSRVNVVSIPRDLIVDIPACQRSDGSTSKAQRAQFNWAYSIGSLGGDRASAVVCTWKTVEKLSGIHIDESIVVDFNGFSSMIDALGGINIYVPTKIDDKINSGLVLEPGCKHFNGKEALAYARVRHGVKGSDGSDIQRIQRQQAVMGIMMRAALQKNMLTSLNQLYGFVGNGLGALTMSEGLSSVSQLTGLGWSLQSLKPDKLLFLTLPVYEAPFDHNRLLLSEKKAEPIWDSFINDTPLPAGVEVRDGNGNVHTITEENPASQSPQDGASPSVNASETPATSASTPQDLRPVEDLRQSGSLNSKLSPEELAELQRKCEAGN
ncbi:LCP family protein [Varibaculum cambriense]|uniref:LCP family protein n=1 Tax=Varibaculum cambriense TaxID=184870 RepID=UPI0024327EA6|nr:LCP family protein [Varibaculum cambriense]WIK88822.1 LCP family protein [Varibaculum cambriense]